MINQAYEFELDMNDVRANNISYTQYSSDSCKLAIELLNIEGDLTGCTVNYIFENDNSKVVAHQKKVTITDVSGKFEGMIPDVIIEKNGLVYCQVFILGANGEKLYSPKFSFVVNGSIIDGKLVIESLSNFTNLYNIINTLEQAEETIQAAADKKVELDNSIDVSNASKNALDTSITNANTSKTNLDNSITTAETKKSELDDSINNANTSKNNLDTSKSDADLSKTNLDAAIETGNTLKNDLNSKITTGTTLKNNLDTDITEGTELKNNLDNNISQGATLKIDLDNNIVTGNTLKTELEADITTAAEKKTELQNVIDTADTTTYATKGEINEVNTQLADIAKQTTEESKTPDIYNTSSFFQVGKGTDENGDDVGDTYKDSILNGQVTDCRIEGRTYTNLLGAIGDFEVSTVDWTRILRGATYGIEGGRLKITTTVNDTDDDRYLEIKGIFNANSYYFLRCCIEADAVGIGSIRGISSTPMISLKSKSVNNGREEVALKLATQGVEEYSIVRCEITNAIGTVGNVWFDKYQVVEITEDEYNNLTEQELLEKYPYINNSKSTICAQRIKSIKNFVKNGDGEKYLDDWILKANTTFTLEDDGFFQVTGDSSYRGVYQTIKVPRNTNFYFGYDKLNVVGLGSIIVHAGIGVAGATIRGNNGTFNTGDNEYITLEFMVLNPNDVLKFRNVYLIGGMEEKSYESYNPQYCYFYALDENGDIVKLGSVGDVSDKFRYIGNGQGEVEKNIEIDETKIKNFTGWTLSAELSNTIVFSISIAVLDINDMYSASVDNYWESHVNAKLIIDNYEFPNVRQNDVTNIDIEGFTVNNGRFYVRIDKAKLATLDNAGVEQYLQSVIVSLTYQLTEPKEYPLIVKGEPWAYKDGHILVEPYIPKEFIYKDNKITLPYAVESIDQLLNKKGEIIEKEDITLADDGLSFAVVGATNGDVFMVYAPIRKELNANGTFSAKYLTGGVKSQVESLNRGQQELYSDMMSVQDQLAMLIVMSYQ